MPFNIAQFSSNIGQYGVLSSNKFMVFFNTPYSVRVSQNQSSGGSFLNFATERLLQLRAEQARLPAVLLQTDSVKRYGTGVEQKMPFNVQFGDTSFTFVADAAGELYNYFYNWLNTIIDFGGSQKYRGEASYEVNYKDDYSTNIDIYVFDNTGGLTHTVTLFDAFPNSLNDINLDWGNQNSAMKITVGFTFRDWSLAPASGNILGLNMGTFNPAFFYPNAAIYAVDNLLSQVF